MRLPGQSKKFTIPRGLVTPPSDPAAALKTLGSVDSEFFEIVGRRSNHETPPIQIKEQIRALCRVIPPRSYTDTLIKHFFDHVNYLHGFVSTSIQHLRPGHFLGCGILVRTASASTITLLGLYGLLAVLRPLLTTSSPQPETTDCVEGSKSISASDRREIIGTANDVALALTAKCRDLFILCFPDLARNFTVAFCPFDTAATLCSALRHDQDRRTLPRQMEIVAAIGCALYISKKLVSCTEIGMTTWNILSTLVLNVGLNDVEKAALEEAMKAGRIDDSRVGGDALPHMPEAGTLSWGDFNSTEKLWINDMNDPASSQIDLGALNGAWVWNGINSNPFYE
jgi:hypothetical protein